MNEMQAKLIEWTKILENSPRVELFNRYNQTKDEIKIKYEYYQNYLQNGSHKAYL